MKKKDWVLVGVNGDCSVMTGPPTLDEMQKFVGGYVELIKMGGKYELYANEDGLRLNLDPNQCFPFLVGNVIFQGVFIPRVSV